MQKGLVQGVGINDALEPVTKKVNGVRIWIEPSYKAWSAMLKRCYCSSTQKNQPQYIGCSVAAEWLLYSTFKEWFYKQDYKGKFLSKDIINGAANVYSPENCAYVLRKTRFFVSDFENHGENTVLGVYPSDFGYNAVCRNPSKPKAPSFIGTFKTQQEAQNAWVARKLEFAIQLAEQETDVRIKQVLLSKYL